MKTILKTNAGFVVAYLHDALKDSAKVLLVIVKASLNTWRSSRMFWSQNLEKRHGHPAMQLGRGGPTQH